MSDMTRMEKVSFLEDYRLEIVLTDGSCCFYDMKPKLKTVRFYDLESWGTFSRGILRNGQVICWDNGTELSIDEILPHGQDR